MNAQQANGANQNQGQPQMKEIDPVFHFFYDLFLFYCIGSSGFALKGMIDQTTEGFGLDKFNFFVGGWYFVMCVMAFFGYSTKDRGLLEKSLTMMKIYFPLIIISTIDKWTKMQAIERIFGTRYGSPVSEYNTQIVFSFVSLIFFLYLPTEFVINVWKTSPQQEEQRRRV